MITIFDQNRVKFPDEDKIAIDHLFDQLSDAWDCGDGEAYASLFLEDAVFVGVFGFRLKGRSIIKERHQDVFNGIFKYSRLESMCGKQLQPLTNDVVLIHSDGDIYFPGEVAANSNPSGMRTLSVVKVDGTWKVASFQNTPTGSFRHIKFVFRFLRSRFYLLNPTWKKAYLRILEQKQQIINEWKNQPF